jgi:signal transduction histidine kinase
MRQPRSIQFHLSLVFVLFFLLIFFLGMLSIARLRDFNKVSADIADLWLPNTRVLGDLNNYTSDFRAAEGNFLLSPDTRESEAIEREMIDLDRIISQSQESYERIRHDADALAIYRLFREEWNEYRKVVNQMLELMRSGRKGEAVAMYMTTSRTAYDTASDELGRLTTQAVENARDASGRVEESYRQAIWLIGTAMAFAGVLVVGALVYIRRSLSRPLLRLAGYMHRLAANDTDIEIGGTERNDEIGEMARAAVVFRNNAIELMVRQRGLAQQASMLEEKLAAERHMTQLQRNFVSMASHEFRTPLTIIDGHARRLVRLGDGASSEDTGARAGKIRAAVLRMTHLIDNLLTSTRLLESGAGLYFHPEDIDLRELLHDVCQLHREISPGSRIVEEFGSQSLNIVGDPKLLSQVFDNLLSNAVKFAPGGVVRVGSSIEKEQIAIVVADTGIGIPPHDLPRLFERYYRGSNVSGIVGTGVGLNLVKMVVDLHGGDIAVDSTEGRGARFTVRLPMGAAAPSSEASTGGKAGAEVAGLAGLATAESVGSAPPAEHRLDAV